MCKTLCTVGRTSKSLVNKYISFDKLVLVEQRKDMTREKMEALYRDVESTKTPLTLPVEIGVGKLGRSTMRQQLL